MTLHKFTKFGMINRAVKLIFYSDEEKSEKRDIVLKGPLIYLTMPSAHLVCCEK